MLSITEKNASKEWYLILQANLWLNNDKHAAQALNALASKAIDGDSLAFFRVKEQCAECHRIGIGDKLVESMKNSPYAVFLEPFILALLAAGGDTETMLGAAEEVRSLAADILSYIEK